MLHWGKYHLVFWLYVVKSGGLSFLTMLSWLQMAFAHDSVRVLQCFIQFGSHEQRQEVFEEIKGEPTSFTFSSAAFLTVSVCLCVRFISKHCNCRYIYDIVTWQWAFYPRLRAYPRLYVNWKRIYEGNRSLFTSRFNHQHLRPECAGWRICGWPVVQLLVLYLWVEQPVNKH